MAGLVDNYLVDAVTVVRKGNVQPDGTMAYDGATTDTAAWVRDRSGVLRQTDGRELTYQRIIYLSPSETIALQDRIVFGNVAHEVLMIDRVKDLTGSLDHIKCYVGTL